MSCTDGSCLKSSNPLFIWSSTWPLTVVKSRCCKVRFISPTSRCLGNSAIPVRVFISRDTLLAWAAHARLSLNHVREKVARPTDPTFYPGKEGCMAVRRDRSTETLSAPFPPALSNCTWWLVHLPPGIGVQERWKFLPRVPPVGCTWVWFSIHCPCIPGQRLPSTWQDGWCPCSLTSAPSALNVHCFSSEAVALCSKKSFESVICCSSPQWGFFSDTAIWEGWKSRGFALLREDRSSECLLSVHLTTL